MCWTVLLLYIRKILVIKILQRSVLGYWFGRHEKLNSEYFWSWNAVTENYWLHFRLSESTLNSLKDFFLLSLRKLPAVRFWIFQYSLVCIIAIVSITVLTRKCELKVIHGQFYCFLFPVFSSLYRGFQPDSLHLIYA